MPAQARNGVAAKPKLPCAEDPELFFPASYRIKETAEAKRLCRGCPDRIRCATQVAAHGQTEGVYAAMTPKERFGLAALVAAAGGDVSRVLRWFDDREALATAHRMRNNGVARDVADRIVGLADLERARLVRRWAPHLVDQVVAGVVTLREAAVQASIAADAGTEKVAA